MTWKVYAASAIGKYHIDNDLPCQDDSAATIANDYLIAVVCDGAGSAAHSEVGAKECSNSIVRQLASRIGEVNPKDVEGFRSGILEPIIDQVRNDLKAIAEQSGYQFADLASTVVGCVISPAGGYLFHIGDGFGVVESTPGDVAISSPENGEYDNETYFITVDDWKKRLRITPVNKFSSCRVALMSDGAAPFVVNREKTGLFKPFIEPVVSYLIGVSEADGCEALKSTLSDEKTYAITGDDKTLLIGIWE